MVSVEEAKRIIGKTVHVLSPKFVPLESALGFIAASDIRSKCDLPPFDQSDKDGHAIRHKDIHRIGRIAITGISAAGASVIKSLGNGQSMRIFTGAQVPKGADTVVMQEHTEIESRNLIIKNSLIKKGENIRKQGAQCKRGDKILAKGTVITPGVIAFLASSGISRISVIRKPTVSILLTGNELQERGSRLKKGKIYDANGPGLIAALHRAGITGITVHRLPDDLAKLRVAIRKALKNSDLVLLTGGVSVGEYDLVPKAMEAEGVVKKFHRVSQRPGKPLFFGKKGKTALFGLPGNPSAVMHCFYEYVLPAIKILSGYLTPYVKSLILPISETYNKSKDIAEFVRAVIREQKVVPIAGQESYKTSSFAVADCCIYLPSGKSLVQKGELVEVHQIG